MDIREIYIVQENLQEAMGNPGDSTGMLLGAAAEVFEALNETAWKPWKPEGYKEVDKDKLATELMDIVQFVFNAAIYNKIGPKELELALRAKWRENDRRISRGLVTSRGGYHDPII